MPDDGENFGQTAGRHLRGAWNGVSTFFGDVTKGFQGRDPNAPRTPNSGNNNDDEGFDWSSLLKSGGLFAGTFALFNNVLNMGWVKSLIIGLVVSIGSHFLTKAFNREANPAPQTELVADNKNLPNYQAVISDPNVEGGGYRQQLEQRLELDLNQG